MKFYIEQKASKARFFVLKSDESTGKVELGIFPIKAPENAQYINLSINELKALYGALSRLFEGILGQG